MLIIIASFLGCVLILAGVLYIVSPGKLKPFLDENGKPLAGSISEKCFVKINAVKQGMFIRGRDIKNPVLLYVHGGPAFPNYFLIDKFAPGLENNFTVCYWEQRGGGLSYSPDVPLESMNFEQLASDAIEVTNYLRDRFGKEKIYMIAHSGGTYDMTVNSDLSKAYLNQLQAPVKAFYTFNESAHSPIFEEPQRFIEILLKDVLNGTTSLADSK